MNEKPDSQLLSEWLEGDMRSGRVLVDRYLDTVTRFFYSKVPVEATDLTQQAFLRLTVTNHEIAHNTSFRVHLMSIARVLLGEHLRTAFNLKGHRDFGSFSIADLTDSPGSRLADRARRYRLAVAFDRLALDVRITLELYYWEDFSVNEIAKILCVSRTNVKSRLHRGRLLLRRFLGENDDASIVARLRRGVPAPAVP